MEFRTLAEGLQFPEGPVALADGSVVLVEIAAGTLTRIAPDGTKSIVAKTGGGPNGAAVGSDGKCYVANNGGFEWHREDGHIRPLVQARDYSGGRAIWMSARCITPSRTAPRSRKSPIRW